MNAYFPEQGKEAEKELCEFFGTDDISNIPVLNQADRTEGRYQRIILVARYFRPVVTSTVMWLRKHKVEIKCIKTALYEHGGNIFIDTEQIIPPVKDVAEYEGQLKEKNQEEKRIISGTQRQYSESQKSFRDNFDLSKQWVDEACNLLLQQSGGKLSKTTTSGGQKSLFYIHRITGYDWGTYCFGFDHGGWNRLSKHGIKLEHFFNFVLTKEGAEDVDYAILTQGVLEKCGFVYTRTKGGWWIYDHPLELNKAAIDAADNMPQKIVDAVTKIAGEITKAYHEAKSS